MWEPQSLANLRVSTVYTRITVPTINVFYLYRTVICLFNMSLTYSFRMIRGDNIEILFIRIVCVEVNDSG